MYTNVQFICECMNFLSITNLLLHGREGFFVVIKNLMADTCEIEKYLYYIMAKYQMNRTDRE